MHNDSNMSFHYACGVEFISHINTRNYWHFELGLIGKRTMDRMIQCDLMLKIFNNILDEKWECCVPTNSNRKSTNSITRSTSILGLLQIDICDNNNDLTRGGKDPL